jgi:xanthine/CO dehydrogenase XdhC/CoxF family maturation factor
MTDLENILPLWRELKTSGADYVLATVVAVEGPSYRKPGARMLLANDGRRRGTVSGGCLEAEVARRSWWLTESGPVVERYSTVEDDGDMPYGSGCGGVVFLLLERRATAAPLLAALEAAFNQRVSLAIATVLEGPNIAHRAFAGLRSDFVCTSRAEVSLSLPLDPELNDLADLAFARRTSIDKRTLIGGTETRVWADYRPARPGLWIFGAGDDAIPLLRLSRELGWFVAVADGRSHLATRGRFRAADAVSVLPIADLPDAASALDLRPTDAAVVMTHSFEQDSRILASLLALEHPLAYLGVLGPQRRTRELLAEAARLLQLPHPTDRAELWLARLHAPTGIDLGAETPVTIALSIVAEIQQTLAAASAQPMSKVRAASPAVTT